MERSDRRSRRKTKGGVRGSRGSHRAGGAVSKNKVPVTEQLKQALYGMYVTDAAKMLGMSRPNFSKVLHGRHALSIELAFRLERRCGLDARRLLHEQLDEQIANHKTGELK